jgi:hypothetical protein
MFKRGFASGRVQDCDTFNVALPGIDDPNVSYRRQRASRPRLFLSLGPIECMSVLKNDYLCH